MRRKILFIIGILLVIVAFLLSAYSAFRLVSLALGLFLIVLQIVLNNPRNIFLIISLPIVLGLACYGVDCLLFAKADRMPIFVYKVKSSDKVSVYNSFAYRIYDCDGKQELDYGYEMHYVCGNDDLEVIDVNEFLAQTLENYKEYRNKFVKIEGKISKIIGLDTIEMNAYTKADDELNGYVSFDSAYTISALLNSDLTSYRIYDEVTIIGLVDTLEEEKGNYVVNLVDAIVIPNHVYDEYTYEIEANNSDEFVNLVEAQKMYLFGLKNIYVRYDEDLVYELSYLITDKRITLDNIIKDVLGDDILNEEEVVVGKWYALDKFNVVICDNEEVIFSNKNYRINSNICV